MEGISMSKAEERALEFLPSHPNEGLERQRKRFRQMYEAGYEQAEKDVLKDARWIEIYDDTTWKMVDDFVHQNMDGAYRVIIVKK